MSNPTLEKLIMNCEIKRIASPFQCQSLKEKVSQYLLTSSNILFGQKLEQAMKEVLIFCGASFDEMPRRIMGYGKTAKGERRNSSVKCRRAFIFSANRRFQNISFMLV